MRIFQRGVLPPVQLDELDTDVYNTGSFVPAWSGFSVDPTSTWTWYLFFSKFVVIDIPLVGSTGTSNSAATGITNWPSEIRAATGPIDFVLPVRDNGSERWGVATIATSASVDFGLLEVTGTQIRSNLVTWTPSGTKGFTRSRLTYMR